MGQIVYDKVKEAAEYRAGIYDFEDWGWREFELV